MVRAFLIGAGATRAQYPQAPLTSDFFRKLFGRNPEVFESINNNLPNHIKEKKLLLEMDIEEVMSLSYDFDESIRNSFIQEIYLSIYELLAVTTGSTDSDMAYAISGSLRGLPTLFNKLLNEPRLKDEDFFMTLNYDLYLDREIIYHQKHIDYGIPGDKIIGGGMPLQMSRNSLSVYHLHGALNWTFAGNNRDKMDIEKCAVFPSWSRGNPNLCLVPPGKKELYPILKQVWKVAEERLMKSDELIIIGCSLNPNDNELNSLISKFVNLKGPNKIKIISSNDSQSIDNYHRIIGQGLNLHNHGFNLINPTGYKGSLEFIFS